MRKLILLGITLTLSLMLHAQTWPVQLSTQLVPPFSGYLSDYSSPNNDNFRIFITLTDFSQPSYDVKLKFRLTGNNITIQSKPWFYAGPFTLEPGVPLMLSGSDLATMLNSSNLDFSGITLQQYNQTKVLPEGFYTIAVTAYDFNNPLNIQVSNEATTQAWVMLCDPPLLSLPLCGTEQIITNPQQLTFSWTPLNLTAPSSALGHEFLFELWEVMPPNNPPGNVVLSSAPIYSTTTTQTILNYGMTEPPLQTGWTYVWRVRAYDLEGRELFRNNGYSQICTFTWGSSNSQLGNLANLTLTAQTLSHRQARCMWDSNSVYTSYHLEFRKVNTPNWFPINTAMSSARINSLEPQATYEAQVHGYFSNGEEGPWSNIVTFTTPAQALLNCGESSPPPSAQNFSPLTQATTGMIWQVGQFEMSVTSLSNMSDPNGIYTGTGKIIMPLGVALNCTFAGIQVGSDLVMYSGEVRAVTEGVGSWMTQWQLFQMFENVDYNYNGSIDSVYISNGQIIILGDSGQITLQNYTPPFTIQSSDGTTYTILPDGSIVIENPIPHIDLTAQQKNVYREALRMMREENSLLVIGQYESNYDSKKQAIDAQWTTDYGTTWSTPSQPPSTSEVAVYMSYLDYDSTEATQQPSNVELEVKQAEFELIRAKVCRAFARPYPTDFDFDLLANFLLISGMPSHLYIAQQLSSGGSEEELAEETKSAIYELIDAVLYRQMFAPPSPD